MYTDKRRVVITGLGAITPIGNTVQEYWEQLLKGTIGIDQITRFDASEFPVTIAGEVKNFDPLDHFEKKDIRKLEDFVKFSLIASREAYKDAGLDKANINHDRAGAVIGSGIGGLRAMEEQYDILVSKGPRRVSPFMITRMIVNMAAGYVAIELGLKGPNTTISTAIVPS